MGFPVLVYGDMESIQSDSSDFITPAIVGADCSEFFVSGEYISAGELIETASYVNGVLTVPGRDVVKI